MQFFFLTLAVFNIISSVFSLPMLNVPRGPDEQAEPVPSMTRPSGEIWTFYEGDIFRVKVQRGDHPPASHASVVIGYKNNQQGEMQITWAPLYTATETEEKAAEAKAHLSNTHSSDVHSSDAPLIMLHEIDPSLDYNLVFQTADGSGYDRLASVALNRKLYQTALDGSLIENKFAQTISGSALKQLRTSVYTAAGAEVPKSAPPPPPSPGLPPLSHTEAYIPQFRYPRLELARGSTGAGPSTPRLQGAGAAMDRSHTNEPNIPGPSRPSMGPQRTISSSRPAPYTKHPLKKTSAGPSKPRLEAMTVPSSVASNPLSESEIAEGFEKYFNFD